VTRGICSAEKNDQTSSELGYEKGNEWNILNKALFTLYSMAMHSEVVNPIPSSGYYFYKLPPCLFPMMKLRLCESELVLCKPAWLKCNSTDRASLVRFSSTFQLSIIVISIFYKFSHSDKNIVNSR